MANASLEPIYDRLNGVQRYHPFSAKTFTDWASEAGDTVQISREGTVYTAPVHKQSLVWRGKHMINMQSTGTRERTPIERMSNQKENETSAGMSSSRGYGGGAGKAIKALQYDFYDEDGIYHSQLYMDEQRFTTIFTKTGIDGLPEGTSLMTRINQNANEISLEAIRAQGAETNLSGRITVEAGKITQIVSAVGANGQVTAASIVLAINESEGSSEAKIDAGHVYIGNDKSTTVIAGKLNASDVTAEYLNAKIATIPTLTGIAAKFSGNVSGAGGLFGQVYVGSGTSFTNISDPVMYVRIDGPTGNQYTLQYKTASSSSWTDAGTFSRATTLSGAWSGGTYTVTASPQGDTISSSLFSVAAADITWDGNTATFPVYANLNGGETRYSTGKTLSVDASSKAPASGVASGRPGTTYDWSFAIKNSSGTTIKNLTIDCSAIYSDARTGYTQGTFTLATVTLQGSQVSGTCYHTVPTGGTVYYTAGSAVTKVGNSVTPTAVSGYRRGSSVSMSRDTIYRKGTGGAYTEIGYCYYCQSTAGASTLYKGGDYFSYNDVGTSSTLYYSGGSVTPISGGGVRLSTVTAYSAGSTVSNTYYTKS